MPTIHLEPYWLSKDCFACRSQGYWVVLSVDRDCYFGVLDADLASIAPWLHGLNFPSRDADFPSDRAQEPDALLDSMLQRGIITRNANKGKPFAESDFLEADSFIREREYAGSGRLSVSLIVRFMMASARADYRLHRRRLSQTLRTVARTDQRLRGIERRAEDADRDQTSKLIAAFKRLRPFYPRPYLCLFDSLALLAFLASYRVPARVVFGVIAEPFEAHCWLQSGSIVLNDDLERVRKYKPILSV